MPPGRKKIDRGSGIDPRDHVGIAFTLAREAARRYGGEADDYLGYCYQALADAARTFDPAVGTTFSTHAYTAIRLRLRVFHRRENLLQKPTTGGVWKRRWPSQSLNVKCGHRGKAVELHELLPAHAQVGTIEIPPAWLETLTDQEQRAVALRARGATMNVIGEVLGITGSRVQQILAKCEQRLREAIAA